MCCVTCQKSGRGYCCRDRSFPAIFFKGQSSLYYSFPVTDIESNTVRYRRTRGAPGRGRGWGGWTQGKAHRATHRASRADPTLIQPRTSALRRNIIADQVVLIQPSRLCSSYPHPAEQVVLILPSSYHNPTLIQPRGSSKRPRPYRALFKHLAHPTTQ